MLTESEVLENPEDALISLWDDGADESKDLVEMAVKQICIRGLVAEGFSVEEAIDCVCDRPGTLQYDWNEDTGLWVCLQFDNGDGTWSEYRTVD